MTVLSSLLSPPLSLEFCTPLGQHLKSTRAALELLQRTEPANEEDLAKLAWWGGPKADKWIKTPHTQRKLVKKAAVPKLQPPAKSKSPSFSAAAWEEDSSLPAGWKVRRGKGEQEVFMVPGTGKGSLQGRLRALEYMARGGYRQEEIAALRGGLKR